MSIGVNKVSTSNPLGKRAITVQSFYFGVNGGDDYGQSYETGFYNGINMNYGGYAIYINNDGGIITAHAPKDDAECLYYLNRYGANATNISDALDWASAQYNLVVRSSQFQLSDLP